MSIFLNSRGEDIKKCAICNCDLTRTFPNDFPDEWKFCCGCKIIVEMLIEGTPTNMFSALRRVAKLVKEKITLVKGNGY